MDTLQVLTLNVLFEPYGDVETYLQVGCAGKQLLTSFQWDALIFAEVDWYVGRILNESGEAIRKGGHYIFYTHWVVPGL